MVSSENRRQNKSKGQHAASGAEIQETNANNTSHTVNRTNRGQKTGTHDHSRPLHRFQTQRSSGGSPPLYIMVVGALVLLAGSYILYVSSSSMKPWSPAPESGESFEPTPVSMVQPPTVQVEEPIPTPVSPMPKVKDIVQQSLRPNAVVDVPNVGLRNLPDIAGKAMLRSLRRGERVEIVKRISGKGPAWVKIKTKSGKEGWVFASVVKEQRGG